MSVTNIMIVGVGGQGTLLTSRILGGLAEQAGYDVKLSEVHGMAQRGGSVVTYVRYATEGEIVTEPIVEEGCADVLIAFERLEALRYAHFLKKDGALIVNDQRIDPMPVLTGAAEYPEGILEGLREKYRVFSIDAMAKAEELGIKLGDFMMPVRMAVTGSRVSPPLIGSIAVLGKEKSVARIERAIASL